MNKLIKKHGLLVVSVFFCIIIAAIALIVLMSFKNYSSAISQRDAQINNLQQTLTNIGELKVGYVVTGNVRAGQQITGENIRAVDVPAKIGLNIATSEDQLLNKYFKVSLQDGTVITTEDIIDRKLDNTERYFDVYATDIPIGLKAGDYIDVRLTFPFGQDFIAISHKKVNEINSGILKLELNEAEIYTYRSMLADVAVYNAQIYAVQYIDGGAQSRAEVYYPINTKLQELYSINPNITDIVEAKIALDRYSVEAQNGGDINTKTDVQIKAINSAIDSLRRNISQNITNAQRELEQRMKQQEQKQAKQ